MNCLKSYWDRYCSFSRLSNVHHLVSVCSKCAFPFRSLLLALHLSVYCEQSWECFVQKPLPWSQTAETWRWGQSSQAAVSRSLHNRWQKAGPSRVAQAFGEHLPGYSRSRNPLRHRHMINHGVQSEDGRTCVGVFGLSYTRAGQLLALSYFEWSKTVSLNVFCGWRFGLTMLNSQTFWQRFKHWSSCNPNGG